MSKMMRYFSTHKETQLTHKLYLDFTKELIQTIEQRQISLREVDLDDPLIDLALHDV